MVAVNTAAMAAFGRSRDALLAASYWDLTLSGQKQRELALVQRRELPFGKEFLRGDGEPVTVQVIGCAPLANGDGDGHVCAFTVDATDAPRRDIESALRWQNHLLLRLACSDAIDSGDLSRALPAITAAAAAGLDCERASVWLYSEGERSLRCIDLYLRKSSTHEDGLELFARDFPRYFAALAEDRTIAASDAHTHPATREFSSVYLAPLGIGAMLEAPIRRMGRPVGVLCNEHVGPARSFSPEEPLPTAAAWPGESSPRNFRTGPRSSRACCGAAPRKRSHAARHGPSARRSTSSSRPAAVIASSTCPKGQPHATGTNSAQSWRRR